MFKPRAIENGFMIGSDILPEIKQGYLDSDSIDRSRLNVSATSDQITEEAAARAPFPAAGSCPIIPREALITYPATATNIGQPAGGAVDPGQAPHTPR
jgi:hypothetical protein